jgi:uncharacterized protein YukE
MSGRPTDWYVLDLDGDPTPGDPLSIQDLARRFMRLARDAAGAATAFRRAVGDEAIASWVGLSGDAYRAEIGDLPADLEKLSASYGMAGRALTGYAGHLDAAQARADAALARGREARARLTSAQSGLATAEAGAARAMADARGLTIAAAPVPAGTGGAAPAPDPAVVSAAVRDHAAAATRVVQARSSVDVAHGELDAARRLARAALSLREDAEKAAVREIRAASDAGIHHKKWWQKLGGALAKGWHVLVEVAKVVVLVLGVIALIVGGPLAWIVFAAALIVLADTLLTYSQRKASVWDVALTALACIPMTKGLTSLGEIGTALREGEGLLGVGRLVATGAKSQLGEMISAVRGLGRGLTTVVRGLPGALVDSVRIVEAAGADGSRLIARVAGDSSPLRDLLMAAAADAHGADGLPAGWKQSVSPSEFNLVKGDNGILSTLDGDGLLQLVVDASPASELRGRTLFDAAMTHFGDGVKVVQGAWYYGDNLGKVNDLLAGGLDLEDAIVRTWTGSQAARYGFSVPEIVESELESTDVYDHLVVRFHRPGD